MDIPCSCGDDSNGEDCQSKRCRLTGRVGVALRRIYDWTSSTDLFRRCIRSDDEYRAVSCYLQEQSAVEDIIVTPRSGTFKNIPVELVSMVIIHLPMRTRINFSLTCRNHRAIVGQTLLDLVGRSLKPYNLSLVDFRFLQSCTGTIMAGMVLKHLIFMDDGGGMLKSPASPPSLDLYCYSSGARDVSRFLSRATGYTSIGSAHFGGGVLRVFTLTSGAGPTIQVFATLSVNPVDALFHLPTSADMGALMLDRIFHAYPLATFDGLTMTTPARLPLENLVTEQRVWDILHANEEIGLAVDAVWDRPHRCGIDFSCPLTWRTSRDRGSMCLRLGSLPASAIDTVRIWRDNTTVGWSMGAMSSCDSCALGAWDNARSYLDAEHQRWRYAIRYLSGVRRRPE